MISKRTKPIFPPFVKFAKKIHKSYIQKNETALYRIKSTAMDGIAVLYKK